MPEEAGIYDPTELSACLLLTLTQNQRPGAFMWQLSKANRLKMWILSCPWGVGQSPLYSVSYIFMSTCVFHEANNTVKVYLGAWGFVCVYSVCIHAILGFVFKSDCFWFYVCKVAPILNFFFPCGVPNCDPNRVLCAN